MLEISSCIYRSTMVFLNWSVCGENTRKMYLLLKPSSHMVSGEPFPDRSRAHVVLTCRNGVPPNLLPVTAASDRPWTTLSTHVPINKNLKVDWIYSDDDDGFACVYVFFYFHPFICPATHWFFACLLSCHVVIATIYGPADVCLLVIRIIQARRDVS